ncbi:MAG: amidohydrolase family protein [Ottowia sp.]|uniref:amidohydrolase family protein n=1 Tax=Ottowia sp. TaxID=1898956 RepID=UPI0039E3DDBD
MPRENEPRETILEPELPIVDAHHHLWDLRALMAALPPGAPPHVLHQALERSPLYLLDQFAADTGSGHNVVATVFMECGAMYRARGPEDMRVVGEVEFAGGIAAMAASGTASSQALADEWRPVETCIEAFGARRAMFESSFPVDKTGCSYATLWNAFKRLASGASQAEKAVLFAGTAAEFYCLAL